MFRQKLENRRCIFIIWPKNIKFHLGQTHKIVFVKEATSVKKGQIERDKAKEKDDLFARSCKGEYLPLKQWAVCHMYKYHGGGVFPPPYISAPMASRTLINGMHVTLGHFFPILMLKLDLMPETAKMA